MDDHEHGDEDMNEEDMDHEHYQCNADYLPEEDNLDKNPRNYAYLPSCYTKRIAPAGKITYRSESVFNVIKSL